MTRNNQSQADSGNGLTGTQISEIDAANREVLDQIRARDEITVVYEDSDIVVMTDSLQLPEVDAIASQHDVPRQDVLELMWDRLPSHIDTGIGSPYEYSHPIVVPTPE